MWNIEFLAEAEEELVELRPFDQQRIVTAIETMLSHEPMRESRNRKRLRPNRLAEWELRVEAFRVFYDVDVPMNVVRIVAIGEKKGRALFIRGERFDL